MRNVCIAIALVFLALYGLRYVNAQEPEQTFGLTCTVSGQEVVCKGTLPQPDTFTSTSTANPATATPSTTYTPSPSPFPATATPTSTRTATSSPSPTRTSTPTPTIAAPPTLTPTPTTPSAYTVEQLISDTTAFNDGSVCPPTNTYDWGIRGHGLTGEGPEGDTLTSWWTAQWLSCGASTPNTIIEIRNYKMYGWTGSGWVTFGGNWNQWCGVFNSTTVGGAGSCTFTSTGVRMPVGQLALHGASWGQPDQNVQCVVVTYQARSNVAVMMNAGADHKNGSSNLWDLFISKLKRVNTDWTPVGGASCTASRLRSNPPPGF